MNATKLFTLFFTAMALFLFTPSLSEANTADGRQAVILFEDEVNVELIEQTAQSVNYIFREIPAASITVTGTQMKALEMAPGVESIAYDIPVTSSAQTIPYGYNQVGMKSLMPSTLTGAGVKIGVLDSGIDAGHPDLQKKVVGGKCLMTIVDPGGCPNGYYDNAGHGTHVAGIIAANNNTFGTVGVAPGASLYAIKVLDGTGRGSTSTLIAGIDWAINQKIDILNISITAPIYEASLEAVVKKAYDAGILLIGAAGNTGPPFSSMDSSVEYPAKFDSVVAVSSIDSNSAIDPLSSLGKEVEVTAPGVKVYSTYPDGNYTTSSGTSMAAPYVSGIAALYMEKYPDMTNKQIRTLLQKNAKDLGPAGRDSSFGYGLIQVDKNPVNREITLSFTTDGNGKVTVDTSQLTAQYGTYNVYRGDILVGKNETAGSWTDYASAGTAVYYFHPVIEGKESETSFITLKAAVENPKIADLHTMKWYDRYIIYLHHEKIMSGFENGTIRPEASITRGEAAILIGKSLGLDGTPRSTQFLDVTENVTSSGYIQSLAAKGITNGFTDGTFRPGQLVTRAEMAILISKAYDVQPVDESSLKDVPASVTGYQYINGIAAAGITGGYEDGTFRPYVHMNRAQFATFLARAINEELR